MAQQLVRLDDRSKAVQQLFTINNTAIINSIPRTMGDPQRLLRIAFNAICYDEKLVQCTHESLMGGVFEALKLGLTLGGPMQEAWLIPFRNRGKLEATFIPGYMGYRNLIDRSRSVLDLHPRAVHVNDDFEVEYGSNPRIWHKPAEAIGKTPGLFVAAYAVARLRGGGLQMEVMYKDRIDSHRDRSKGYQYAVENNRKDTPWITDYEPMALKTTIRVISKYLPKSSEVMARLLELDEKADLGQDQGFDLPKGVQWVDQPPAEKVPLGERPSRVDTLKNALAERTGTVLEQKADNDLSDLAGLDAEVAAREGQQR